MSTEIFRPARSDELPQLARLIGHSFVGRTREQLREMVERIGVEPLWVAEQAGRPVAACHLHAFRQWIAGVAVPMMGLGTVAVAPTHRRRRLAGRLVGAGLRRARERGDLVSALYPFRVAFYEALGYGLAGAAHQYLLPPESLPDAPERGGVTLVEGEAELRALRAVYDRWAPTQTGQLARSEREWQKVWDGDDRAGVLYRDAAGEPQGYAIVRYRADLPPQERFLEVEERAWLTAAAQRALYGWLASLGDQWRLIAYRAHPDEGFEHRVREPRLPLGSAPGWGLWFPAATLLAGPMFRLLDVPGAWRARRVADEARLTLVLEVRDAVLPENDGPWRLRLEGGRVAVEPGGGTADATLRLAVSTLSRLYVGALAPSAAVEAGLAALDRPDVLPRLDAALRLPRPWTFDRF